MTQAVGIRRRRFRRTGGFKARQRLDVVSTKQAKTAGRGSRQEIARHPDNSESSFASRSQNSIGQRRVPDFQNNGGGAQ